MNPPPPQPAHPIVAWLANRATVCIAAAWIVTVLGFAGSLHWLADAMNHPRWHLAWLCGLAALICWQAGKHHWMVAAIACSLVLVITVRPWTWYLPAGKGNESGINLRVLFWNINAATRDTTAIMATMDRENPDLVSLLELNHTHLPGLADLRASHPHFRENPSSDAFGLGVYSKFPVQWIDVASEPPVIRGRIALGEAGGHADFWAVHTLPPIGAMNLKSRNNQMRELAKRIAAPEHDSTATIVGGDFNITPWCREFRSFATDAGLRDSREGHGHQATWPAKLGILGIPIDHVLVDPRTTVISRRVIHGESKSDHAAVLVELRFGDP